MQNPIGANLALPQQQILCFLVSLLCMTQVSCCISCDSVSDITLGRASCGFHANVDCNKSKLPLSFATTEVHAIKQTRTSHDGSNTNCCFVLAKLIKDRAQLHSFCLT